MHNLMAGTVQGGCSVELSKDRQIPRASRTVKFNRSASSINALMSKVNCLNLNLMVASQAYVASLKSVECIGGYDMPTHAAESQHGSRGYDEYHEGYIGFSGVAIVLMSGCETSLPAPELLWLVLSEPGEVLTALRLLCCVGSVELSSYICTQEFESRSSGHVLQTLLKLKAGIPCIQASRQSIWPHIISLCTGLAALRTHR